jgi:hypothetical protein
MKEDGKLSSFILHNSCLIPLFMFQIEHFKTEFVRLGHAKIMGRGRLSLTLRQLLVGIAVGALCNILLRLLPLSNWWAVLGCGLGIWLGSDRAGSMQLARLLMPLLVSLRALIGKPQRVDLSAEWERFAREGE